MLVVDAHGLSDHTPGLFEVGRSVNQKLVFENAIDPLGQRILIAIAAIGHRATHAVLQLQLLVLVRTILDAAIGVVDEGLSGLPSFECHPEGFPDMPGVERVMYVMTDDAPRPGVSDQADIDTTALRLCRQVSDVGHPHLLRAVGALLLRPLLEQIGMAMEAVMAVGGLMVGTPWHDQLPCVAQEIEERITPDVQACLAHRLTQHVLQFACAHARLGAPYRHDRFEDALITLDQGMRAQQSLVLSLSAHAPVLASPAHAQAFDLSLREDLPEGFFTMRTP